MVFRVRALLASAALVAALGPLAAQAQSVTTPDSATATAIAQWHADALQHVAPAYHDPLAAMYADQPISDPTTATGTAAAKIQAEQLGMADLDASSQALIEHYYAQVEIATFAGIPAFSESND
jgi:hypothetical protein